MKPILCISIMENTQAEIIQLAERMSKTPTDMVEWRMDFFQEKDSPEKLKECLAELRNLLTSKKLLLTMRVQTEGGHQDWNQEKLRLYLKFLTQNIQLYDGVDIELSTLKQISIEKRALFISQLKNDHKLLIGSYHQFQGMEDAAAILNRCKEIGKLPVDIVKVAYLPKSVKDVERFVEISTRVKLPEETKKVMIAMSDLGRELRIRPEITGSAIAYCSYQKETTLGQVSMEEYLGTRESEIRKVIK